ncbi:hypothetical protein BD560DRAFT_401662 [Blakeslea trispora]|nr:hypothetical protein BD560DRAFT_401662 [Blakeslea trispora]
MSYLNGGKSLEGVSIVQDFEKCAVERFDSSAPTSTLFGTSIGLIDEDALMFRKLQLSSEEFLQKLDGVLEKHRPWVLNASRNHIDLLPVELYKFKNMTSLILSNNRIRHIPSDLYRSLRQLKQIDLSGNSIETIPEEMPFYLSNLATFKIDNNLIQQLPDSIGKWQNIRDFQLGSEGGGNLIQRLPITLSSMKSLVSFDLSFNRLEDILPGTFDGLSQLQHLNLSHNRLTDIPQSNMFTDCEALITLDLSKNQLSYLNDSVISDCLYLINQHQLRTLDLSNNRIHLLPTEILSQELGAHVAISGNPIVQAHSFLDWSDTIRHLGANNVSQVHTGNTVQLLRPELEYSNTLDMFGFATNLQGDQTDEQSQHPAHHGDIQDIRRNSDNDLPIAMDEPSKAPSILLLSLHEIALRALLESDDYADYFLSIPKHTQDEIHYKKQTCFHCQKPFFNEWVNSVVSRRCFSASFAAQLVKFCKSSCWHDYHTSLSQRVVSLEQKSSQIHARALETVLEPHSLEWIEAAVTAASLQEERLNVLVNQV